MTEEENKAIEYLKDYIKSDLNYFTIDFNNNLRISMNLIEKLQKENEELKLKDYYLPAWVTKKYVSKDKIREKLEKIEKEKIQYYDAGQPLIYMLLKNQLKSLIEEKQYKNK